MAFMEVKSGKRKLLDDSDSDSEDGGAPIGESGFKVNEEFAKRFEHNKKREERQKCRSKLNSSAPVSLASRLLTSLDSGREVQER